jgi:ABC-type sugar transport system ATPase subunit
MTEAVVAVRGLVKTFPGVVALDGVDAQIRAGEVLGLVGKNGAGKSSLIKILAGVERADAGEILVGGEPIPHRYGPHVAHRLGLAFVHQELGNFPSLTVADNVALGGELPRHAGLFVRTRQLRRRVAGVLDDLEAEIDPDAHVADLTSVEQRLVMIARGLYHQARVLVLDEPTASLTIEEIDHLHAVVRKLRERGHSVVYVSHRLNEIITLTDRIVVMQDGRVVLEQPTQAVSEAALVEAIAGGRAGARPAPPSSRPERARTPLLRVSGLARPPLVRDVSFEVHEGEILGLVGLVGSGRTEVARMLFGADRPAAGTIELEGRRLRLRTPVDAVRRGIALLPEDRRHEGLVLDFSLRENVTLGSLRRHAVRWSPFPRRLSERRVAQEMVERLAIATPGIEQQARRLSGGNQQKVVLAKWLQCGGRLLIFDEPTQGIDVGAKEEIFALIRELADAGRAVIVILSEFSECERLCTRVVALREGIVSGTLEGSEITEEAMIRLAYAPQDGAVAV